MTSRKTRLASGAALQKVWPDGLRIVEKMGGQVGVESEHGTGSLFYFTLPAGPASRGRMSVPAYASQSNPISDLARSI